MTYTDQVLQRHQRLYNPEHDIIPDTPRITVTDYELSTVCSILYTEIKKLRKRLDAIQGIKP